MSTWEEDVTRVPLELDYSPRNGTLWPWLVLYGAPPFSFRIRHKFEGIYRERAWPQRDYAEVYAC